MDQKNQTKEIMEALIFVQNKPIKIKELAKLLDLKIKKVETIIKDIQDSFINHGIKLQTGPEGIQFITIPEANAIIELTTKIDNKKPLTKSTLETLAIVAYKQPITKAGIESIRGVSCDGQLSTLRIKGLVEVSGRAEKIGRPLLFSTTQNFLTYFGLENAEQLPKFFK